MAATLTEFPLTRGPEGIHGHNCFAYLLPADDTRTSVARRIYREAAAVVGLPEELIASGVAMVSELAANTEHAQDNITYDGSPQQPEAGCPELWLYVRGSGTRSELVCKVFDSHRGWKQAGETGSGQPLPGSVQPGRGLRLVAKLSKGRWGHHLTRARLGTWKVPGKAVWFAVPVADSPPKRALTPHEAAAQLASMLAGRGFGDRILRADEHVAGMSVVSISSGLTVWCRGGTASWRTGSGKYERLPLSDLVEIAEQLVRAREEMECAGGEPAGR